MVCSHCGSIGHNKRTCLKSSEATSPEKRAAKALASLLPPPNKMKKVSKPLEGLTGCQNIWKEPKGIYIKKKVNRTPLTGEGVCDYQLVPLDSTALKGASGMIQLPPPRPRSTKSQ